MNEQKKEGKQYGLMLNPDNTKTSGSNMVEGTDLHTWEAM